MKYQKGQPIYLRFREEQTDHVGTMFHIEPVYMESRDGRDIPIYFDDSVWDLDRMPNKFYLRNLTVSIFASHAKSNHHEVEYSNIYKVDEDKCREMARTLKLINRRLQKLDDKYGTARTFGAFAARLAEILKCDGFLFEVENSEERVGYFTYHRYQIWNIKESVHRIDSRVNEVWEVEKDRSY